MRTYRVGYFIGSLSSNSINRTLSRALLRLAPQDLQFGEIPINNLPLYSPDFDSDYPPEARALKDAIADSDAVLFVMPEYNRSIPGALKNAIRLGLAAPGTELVRPHARCGDWCFARPARHRGWPAEPARGVELLQRPADDGARGVCVL